MPELPEVETIVRDLRPILIGDVFEGKKVLEIFRRGKFINFLLEEERVLTIHLRMTGRLIAVEKNAPPLAFERVRLKFGRMDLAFCDMRRFGRIWQNSLADYEEKTGIARLGAEPLEAGFDFGKFKKTLAGKKGFVKKLLLDQSLIAGIGNIYADESCFDAGIRPDAEFSALDEKSLEALFAAVMKSLEQGIRNRGTSVADYRDAYGRNGQNQELLFVYGRGGKPCLRCGESLKKIKLVGRGTVYCECCQKKETLVF